MTVAQYVGSIDQGTTSTRCLVFDTAGTEVARHQLEHRQLFPKPGWVEHDPVEIMVRVESVVAGALSAGRLAARDLAAIGVTNQRETTVVWNPRTGLPWYNAIVWQDARTDREVGALEPRRSWLVERTGLPPATYFSAAKLRWILDHVEGVRAAVDRGEAIFGTIDTWVIWNLTGGPDGGRHVTDVTNASRTQLMNLRTLEAICFQTRDVLDAMTADSGVRLASLKVDGGATANDLLMQMQADVLGVAVVRPVVTETTALGAAYAAGLSTGYWRDLASLRTHWKADRRWEPQWTADQRDHAYERWTLAVTRSFGLA